MISDHDPGGHRHGRVRDPCRGPHDPSALHAISSLHDSDRSEDDTNTPLRKAEAPSALPPIGSDAPAGPSTPRSRHTWGPEPARAARNAAAVARFRYIQKSGPKQGW